MKELFTIFIVLFETFAPILVIIFIIYYFIKKNNKKINRNNNEIKSNDNSIPYAEMPIQNHSKTTQEQAETPQEFIQPPIQTPQQPQQIQKEKFPYYLSNILLSPKEQSFYRTLKPIADEMGLIIFSKMRIVDIVQIPKNHPEYMKWFNYIKAKHIDFILCDQKFRVYKLIEVDDYTHQYKKRQERDDFVNEIFRQLDVDLLRYYRWTPDQLRNDLKPPIIQVQENNLTYTP